LRIFENRRLRRKFGLKRDNMTEICRKLHNKELHDFRPSQSITRMMRSRRIR
jgi:hypothetical protein